MRKLIILLSLIIIIIIIGLVIFFINRKKTNKSKSDQSKIIVPDVLLPDGKKLYQNKEFYDNKYNDTLKYLVAVYPTAEDDLKKMNSLDLAKFYNSLWFYYNCDSTFNEDIVMPVNYIQTSVKSCWNKIPGCGDKWPSLPYVPQGFIYSFKDWLDSWIPWFYSLSNKKVEDISGSFPGQTFANWYNGPSPVWMYQRAIFRMVYDTTLPVIDSNTFLKTPKLSPGDLGIKFDWNYPTNWYLGVPDNGYMEVTAASEPGMSNSPPLCWVDGWPGSGLFVAVGKSFRSTNKANALFGLIVEMSKSEDGLNKLKLWWNDTDPYKIFNNILHYNKVGNDPNISFGSINGPIIWDPLNKKKTQPCNITWNNQTNPESIPSLFPRKQTGIKSIARDKGFWSGPNVSATNYYEWCKESKDKKLNYITNQCIDDIRFDNNYAADRLNNTTLFDEPIFCMAVYLGYDTVQMVRSSNGAGFWQYELMLLYGFPEEVKNRDYSSFIEIDLAQTNNDTSCPIWNKNAYFPLGGVKYKSDFTSNYMKNIYQYFTLRNPFDVNNNDKSVAVEPGSVWTPKTPEYNITVKNHISDMFTGMAIVGQHNDQCNGTPSNNTLRNIERNSGMSY